MSVSSTGYNPSGCRSRQNRQDNRHYKCAYIFIHHFEPRLMPVLYAIPTNQASDQRLSQRPAMLLTHRHALLQFASNQLSTMQVVVSERILRLLCLFCAACVPAHVLIGKTPHYSNNPSLLP